MGGEPLCQENLYLVKGIIATVRVFVPGIKIYVWTGYKYEELLASKNEDLKFILSQIDYLIDGPYIEAERDITLPMCGSRNQRIIDLKARRKQIE